MFAQHFNLDIYFTHEFVGALWGVVSLLTHHALQYVQEVSKSYFVSDCSRNCTRWD